VEANSLYECNNTYQLINFYHATLNYTAVSMLVKAIDKGYLKGFASLTSCQVCQHIKVNNKTEKGHMDQSYQDKQSMKTSSPALSHCHSHPMANHLTLLKHFPRNPSMLVRTLSS
jgi:hypothetical protein